MRAVEALRMRNPASGGGGGDPHWSSVALLLGFETGLNDESSYARSATFGAGSGGGLASSFGRFGTRSFQRNGSAILTFPDAASWPSGTNPFTLEFWVYFTAAPTGTSVHLLGHYDTAGQRSWSLNLESGALRLSLSSDGSTLTPKASAAWAPSINTWYHVAADFDGTNYRTYVNGVMNGKTGTPLSLHNSTAPVSVSCALTSGASNGTFSGYMDEVRITKGVARYASDAGFTVPTAAFPRS